MPSPSNSGMASELNNLPDSNPQADISLPAAPPEAMEVESPVSRTVARGPRSGSAPPGGMVMDYSLTSSITHGSWPPSALSGDQAMGIPFNPVIAPASYTDPDENCNPIFSPLSDDDARPEIARTHLLYLFGPGQGFNLPNKLVNMWNHIDPTLLGSPTAALIIQETYAAYDAYEGPSEQSWVRAVDKSGVAALEKTRIAHGGKIPGSWKEAAKDSEHGRKWLAINKQMEEEEAALVKAREAADFREVTRKRAELAAQEALRLAAESAAAQSKLKRATTEAEKAERAARKATSEAEKAHRKSRAVATAGEKGVAAEPAQKPASKAAAKPKDNAKPKPKPKPRPKPKPKAAAATAAAAAAAHRGKKRKVDMAEGAADDGRSKGPACVGRADI